jgi:hypothetical protein
MRRALHLLATLLAAGILLGVALGLAWVVWQMVVG